MSTAVNTGASQPTGGQMITGGGYNYGQFDAGPAGELATILAQLLELYQKCMADWAQMSGNSANVQAETAQSASQAQISAANDQSAATKCQAWQSGISGAIGAVQLGGEAYASSTIDNNISTQEGELSQMNELNESVQNKLAGDGENTELAEMGQHTPSEDPDVNARIQEMQTGRFQTKLPSQVDDQDVIDAASHEEAQAIKEQLDTQISNKNQQISSLYSQRGQILNKFQQYAQIANGANGGVAQGLQSIDQAKQGLDQATTTTANVASQMAGTAQASSASAMNKAQEEISSEINLFRSAAQAYPQG